MSFLVKACLALAIAAIVVKLIHNYWLLLRMHLRFPSAAFPFPIIGLKHIWFSMKPETVHEKLSELVYNGGPDKMRAMAFDPGLFVFHPETCEPILKSSVNTKKNFIYDVFQPWLGKSVLTGHGSQWKLRRKLLTPAFHFKILETSLLISNQNASTLTDILLRDCRNGTQKLELSYYLTKCTLEVMLRSSMGAELEIQRNREGKYVEAFSKLSNVFMSRLTIRPLLNDFIFSLTPMKSQQDKYLGIVRGLSKSLVEKRRKEIKEEGLDHDRKPNFLDILLTESNLTNDEIQAEVDTFIFAGHDTTGTSLSWTLLLLANHPSIQEKVFKEQEKIFGQNVHEDVTFDHLSEMKYLESVIKESLRLYPPVPLYVRELTEDVLIDGKKLERGYTVGIYALFLHRNPTVWKQPNDFIPERFLAGSSQEVQHHPYAFVPFSAGPRNCIGQRFAIMEMKTILSKLVRNMQFIKADDISEKKIAIRLLGIPHEGAHVYVKPRAF